MAGKPQKGRQPKGKPISLCTETLEPKPDEREGVSILRPKAKQVKGQERRNLEGGFVAERGKALEGTQNPGGQSARVSG